MSGKIFLDTNILVYAHDSSQGTKYIRARAIMDELWASRQGVLSTQVLQEFAFNLRRKMSPPVSTAEAREWVSEYLKWEIVVNTPTSILNALDLEERFQVSFWDAMILQAAENAGAELLYSEDLSDGQRYGAVQVMNPFRDRVGESRR